MYRLFLLSILPLMISCNKNNNGSPANSPGDVRCGDHKSQPLYKEADGDCYYLENGVKVYTEDHECNC